MDAIEVSASRARGSEREREREAIHLYCTAQCEIILFILCIRQCPLLVGSWHTAHTRIALRCGALRIACVRLVFFCFVCYVMANDNSDDDDDVFMLRCYVHQQRVHAECSVRVQASKRARARNDDSVGAFIYT